MNKQTKQNGKCAFGGESIKPYLFNIFLNNTIWGMSSHAKFVFSPHTHI